MDERYRIADLSNEEIERLIAEGRISREEADRALQEAARQDAATRDPDELPDDTERHTTGGFGSGQGMGTDRTGVGPDRPDEQGTPRTEDRDWPT